MDTDTLSLIRARLAANLGVISGYQAVPYLLAAPVTPHLCVFPDEIRYNQSLAEGDASWWVTIQAFAALLSDQGAQQKLDPLLAPSGPQSVKQAAEAEPTLGGVIDDVHVESCTGYRVYARPGGPEPVLGAEWRVRLIE